MRDDAPTSAPLLDRVTVETARMVGLKSRKTLYRWISTGVIPAAVILRVGAVIYLRRQALVEWASSNGANSRTHKAVGRR